MFLHWQYIYNEFPVTSFRIFHRYNRNHWEIERLVNEIPKRPTRIIYNTFIKTFLHCQSLYACTEKGVLIEKSCRPSNQRDLSCGIVQYASIIRFTRPVVECFSSTPPTQFSRHRRRGERRKKKKKIKREKKNTRNVRFLSPHGRDLARDRISDRSNPFARARGNSRLSRKLVSTLRSN